MNDYELIIILALQVIGLYIAFYGFEGKVRQGKGEER